MTHQVDHYAKVIVTFLWCMLLWCYIISVIAVLLVVMVLEVGYFVVDQFCPFVVGLAWICDLGIQFICPPF